MASRQRSSSALSNNSDSVARTSSPARRGDAPSLRRAADSVPEDGQILRAGRTPATLSIPHQTGSPYPSISATPASPSRPRASTADIASASQAKAQTRGFPRNQIPLEYQQGQRYPSTPLSVEASRPQYIPPPPPPQNTMILPPPPPRPPTSNGPPNMVPPPPPGPPPSATNIPSQWNQQGWGRQQTYLPPPPPLGPNQMTNKQAQYFNHPALHDQRLGLLIPGPPHSESHVPLSATYIPGGESFGPGVGIPPLYTQQEQEPIWARDDSFEMSQLEAMSLQNQPFFNGPSSAISPQKELRSFAEHANGSVPQTPQSKGSGDPSPLLPGQKHVDPLLPTHGRSISAGLLSPNDPARDWTLERVLKWLEANRFSNDWQETFGSLNIHGKDFLGLGRAHGGRGNFSTLHEKVYPRLTRVCKMSNGWNPDKEHQEGRRLRKLVREIAESADATYHARHESDVLGSASTNGGVETSPSPSNLEVFTQTPSTAGGEDSPGRQFKPPLPATRNGSKIRSSTVPTYNESNDSRSNLSRSVLGNINDAASRRSPSDHTTFIGEAIRNSHNGSPQSGSPIPSPGFLGARHRKNESTDSTEKRRNGLEFRHDHGRHNSNETPSSAKELSKGFLDRFRRRKNQEPHDDDVESPTSPEYQRMLPPTLLGSTTSLDRQSPATTLVGSNTSLDRPSSARQKKYVFATPDQWNYRLVDVTGADTSKDLRSLICGALNYADHEVDQAFLYLTEPGQVDHDDPLTNSSLMLHLSKADSQGTLKVYVRRAVHSASLMPPHSGLGIGLSPKASPPAGSLFPRKALDERPVSPRTSSIKDQIGKMHTAWESGTLTDDQWGSWLQSAIEEHRKDNPIKGDRVINSDAPRKSPYEKEVLMPTRKPPAPPVNGSQMLEKANSLTRPSRDSIRSSIGSQSSLRQSIDGPPVNTPPKTVGSRRNMPHLNTGNSPQRKFMSQEALVRKISIASRPRSQGPAYSFQESEISFDKKLPQASDDSDDGLFAKPLKKADVSRRPTLTVNTNPRKNKGLSVSFDTEDQPPKRKLEKRTPDTDDPSSYSESPDKFARRQSFMRDDMWANRPAAEDLLNNLDAFFPNLDLDEPVVEDLVSPTSPPAQFRSSLYDRVRPDSIAEEPDTLGSEESTLKSRAPLENRKSVRKSVGLGRMKSIRDVARGAHDSSKRNTRVSMLPAVPEKRNSEIMRRKSTKMFGANIVQLKPGRGSRVSLIETVPKDVDTANSFQIARGQLIGKGSYGKVYLGINLTTGEFLAVKQVQVNQRAAGNDKDKMKEMVKALDQEIDTMQHLEHPNIVAYLGCERKELSISIFLEYISGGSVGSCLRKHGRFDEPLVSSLTRQTLEGLAYLHTEGVLHRDLKADNILLDISGTCKISDFGISKKTDNIYGNDATNNMQGSVFWMAPEVVKSQGQGYSAKVDIWSLGCVVLEMFTGKRPWSKDEVIGAIYKLGTKGEAPPIPEEVTNLNSAMAYGFMLDCFQIDPSERPTAGTLLRHQFVNSEEEFDFSATELAQKLYIEGMQ